MLAKARGALGTSFPILNHGGETEMTDNCFCYIAECGQMGEELTWETLQSCLRNARGSWSHRQSPTEKPKKASEDDSTIFSIFFPFFDFPHPKAKTRAVIEKKLSTFLGVDLIQSAPIALVLSIKDDWSCRIFCGIAMKEDSDWGKRL